MTYKMFFAGSGGQGVLMMGQAIAYAAMMEGKEVTFMPSYGPEMRGGTANCTVIVSDKPISCPLINEADAVVVMNPPSLTKFESMVSPGGKLFVNTSLIDFAPTRTDIEITDIAANDVAKDIGLARSANIVMLGAIAQGVGIVSAESVRKVMAKLFSGSKAHLLEPNLKALDVYLKGE